MLRAWRASRASIDRVSGRLQTPSSLRDTTSGSWRLGAKYREIQENHWYSVQYPHDLCLQNQQKTTNRAISGPKKFKYKIWRNFSTPVRLCCGSLVFGTYKVYSWKNAGKKLIRKILKIFMFFHYIMPAEHQIIVISLVMRQFIDVDCYIEATSKQNHEKTCFFFWEFSESFFRIVSWVYLVRAKN